MNFWLINPKKDGSETDLSDESIDCVFMGWNKSDCPKFYNDVKSGDVIIVTEKSHANSKLHYAGIADKLHENKQCWSLKYSSKEKNEEIESIIRQNPSDFGGGESPNPWGPTKSIIKVANNPAEKKLKELLSNFFKEAKMKENIDEYKSLLLNTHNLILHGAPGTGKTHLAKEIAESMKAEWEFVQFHPSYDYTDFVEGLRPVNGDNGQIGFERKDGVFKKFCEKALENQSESINENNFDEAWNSLIENVRKNLSEDKLTKIGSWDYGLSQTDSLKYSSVDSPSKYTFTITKTNVFDAYSGKKARPKGGFQKDMEDVVQHLKDKFGLKDYKEVESKTAIQKKPFIFIIDEINRGEMGKIFGELFFSIDPGYRGKKGLIKTQYQNLIQENNVFYDGFYVPENVYIIGTMNDIDRSVESMDFAFRRRFTFKEIKANENLGMLDELDDSIREKAEQTLIRLNNAIWNEETKTGIEGLSSAYHIGGAYFLKLKELGNDFDKLWEYHLDGLLREYLRGMEDAETKLGELKSAYLFRTNQEKIDG